MSNQLYPSETWKNLDNNKKGLTFKDVKNIVFTNCRDQNQPRDFNNYTNEWNNQSFKLLQTQSEPNLRSRWSNSLPALEVTSQDSFLETEEIVDKLCLSPRKSKSIELNNTLDIINFILSGGLPDQNVNTHTDKSNDLLDNNNLKSQTAVISKDIEISHPPEVMETQSSKVNVTNEKHIIIQSEQANIVKLEKKTLKNGTPVSFKSNKLLHTPKVTGTQSTPNSKKQSKLAEKVKSDKKIMYLTPNQNKQKTESGRLMTPSSARSHPKTPDFRTPTNQPLSQRKGSATSLRKIPGKPVAYDHIVSPIATYINNTPKTPLIKQVFPKKALPENLESTELIKNTPQKPANKENVDLPSVVYKNTKSLKVNNTTAKKFTPRKLTPSKPLPQPMVLRKQLLVNKNLNKARGIMDPAQHSIDLSLVQANESLYNETAAFK